MRYWLTLLPQASITFSLYWLAALLSKPLGRKRFSKLRSAQMLFLERSIPLGRVHQVCIFQNQGSLVSRLESHWILLEQVLNRISKNYSLLTSKMCTVGGVYVSYTQLHDNPQGTICNGTHVGVRSTQVCADTGVYYLNDINFKGLSPSLIEPSGFSSLGQYGILPWWPVSASATAYRIMNPNGNAVPPKITTTDDSIFGNYMSEFASANPSGLLSVVGQTPGAWSFPVW